MKNCMALAVSMDIYQFKITIFKCFGAPLECAPIWRRIQISRNATFEELHYAILNCIGWEDRYFHVFKAPYPKLCSRVDKENFYISTITNRNLYGIDDFRDEDEWFASDVDLNLSENESDENSEPKSKLDESEVKLCDYFTTPKDMIVYEYDLDNKWSHEVVLEEIVPSVPEKAYPVCIAGERACPPPGCNRVRHYDGFVQVVSNPGVEYEVDSFLDSCKQWLAAFVMKDWNPEFFDPKSVVFSIPSPAQRFD